ncbi:MAG: DUF4835 family protein [Bacteroidota bacterium]
MKLILITLLIGLSTIISHGQELNCMISINTTKIEGTDKKVFETLQNAMYEFVNNRKWSNYNFKPEEKIECTMRITINERLTADEFKGTMNIVVRRPVLNSAYNSTILNSVDKNIQFRYVEYQPLDYSDGTFTSNITSLLAYYSYTVLAFYFDSFSQNGGNAFFEKAQEIVNSAQNTSEPGWKAFDSDKNRYWLVNNYLNPANSGIRDFAYKYHRLGLDLMYDKVDQGRTSATEAIETLQKVYNSKPNLYALQLIFDAKRDEFVNIYGDQKVAPMEKTTIVNILREIDPANSSKYQTILGSN